MNIQLAERMQLLKASDIRELLKVTSQPGVISFAGGLPAPELFPVREMAIAAGEVLAGQGMQALQYSATEGHPPLRRAIADWMNERCDTAVTPDEILITSGSQQGLDMTGKLFLDQGDIVLCESPTYIGALNAFQVFQPDFIGIPTDDDGMIIPELERRLAEARETGRTVKFIYVIPDFQNPSGRRWSLARRRQFMEVVTRYGVPVIEDAPYAALHFDDRSLPALKSLDPANLVCYLGTFSKLLCPGLRIAWLVADAALIGKYVLIKQGTDLHTSTFSQLQIMHYLENYDLGAHVQRIRHSYRERRDTMLAAMDRFFPPNVSYTRPAGGVFLWVELPAHCNARDLLARCRAERLAFVPGGSFFPNGGHENTLRLNYTAMPPDLISEGIQRLARVLSEYLISTPPVASADETESRVVA